MKFVACLPAGGMVDRPALVLNDSTLCLHVETKASPLLGQFQPESPCKSATTPTSVTSLSSASSGSVCYICHCDDTEAPFLSDVCGCKKRYVHSTCLATWLRYSAARRGGAEAPRCEVCLEAFELPQPVALRTQIVSPVARTAVVAPPLHISFGIPGIFAFVYGFSFLSLGATYTTVLYTCTIGNAIVLGAWLLFVVNRLRPPAMLQQRKAVQDVVLLLCVYIMFLLGWMMQEWSLPRYTNASLSAAAHFVNAGCVVACSVARLAYTPCKTCCSFMCAPPSVTISLDLGD